MKTVFIDGSAGTTGLRIRERLEGRKDISLLLLPEEKRKDPAARKEALNSCDAAFLCLPDGAAMEAVAMVENPNVTILDTSTAHRTDPRFVYGFPELSKEQEEKIRKSARIAVPGCHASGFIALVAPLIKEKILPASTPLTCISLTGYSGGGKKMIAEYEDENRSSLLKAPRQYGLTQSHKHLKEMVALTGLETPPLFTPIVADFYSGMEVTVPLLRSDLKGDVNTLKELYKSVYHTPLVQYKEAADEEGFLSAGTLSGLDRMEISVHGNEDRILLVARYDNLGKGASGAAIECMNLRFGLNAAEGLAI